MKYIIVSDGILEQSIVFSDGLTHSHVYMYPNQIRSAGFCRLVLSHNYDIKFTCWGESVSLGVKSRGSVDEAILNRDLSLYN